VGLLSEFTVDGQEVIDHNSPPNEDGDPVYLRDADPERRLNRYCEDHGYINTYTRLNRDLLDIAKQLPVLSCKITPSGPLPEVPGRPAASTTTGAAMILFGRAFRQIENEQARACVLSRQFCQDAWARIFLCAEDADATQRLLSELIDGNNFDVEFRVASLADIGFEFLPLELFFDLVGEAGGAEKQIEVGFGFTSSDLGLKRLEKKAGDKGYVLDTFEPALLQMRLRKPTPVNEQAFVDVIREVFAVSRKAGAHYRSEELISGEVIPINETLPEKYRSEKGSFFSRLLGG